MSEINNVFVVCQEPADPYYSGGLPVKVFDDRDEAELWVENQKYSYRVIEVEE